MEESIQIDDFARLKLGSLGVEAVILFGSRALGLARPTSDVDIGVILSVDYPAPATHRTIYNYLYELITNQVSRPVSVDIVLLDQASVELQVHTLNHGRVLFETQPQVFARFKERVMQRVADFAPYQQLFNQATLARI